MKKNCLVIGALGLILVGCGNSETDKKLNSGDGSQTHWGNTPGTEENSEGEQSAESHWGNSPVDG
ncbi:MAG: hypothetical protein KFB95_09055 [Simkaniaceae bacterium]|nr:MAG: hypothetical protein KFB95_09055 [Simkaniaceae bacterium]